MGDVTLRNVVFQVHWVLGITAGLVLAVVGASGAVLSFEDALLEWLNPGVLTVQAQGEMLAPSVLVARIAAQRPGDEIQSLGLSADPADAALVGFAPRKGSGSRRGERRHVDPHTGQLLGAVRGEAFFRTTMQLHRWLVSGDVGKHIVGASTLALVFFCLSGLYLRWPRGRWRSPRAWLALDWRRRGRALLWQLHAITGTWVLVAYLIMALSGLWWSYGWYRSGLQSLAGMTPSAMATTAHAGAGDNVREMVPFDPDATWSAFLAAAPRWGSATLRWPQPGADPQIRYLDRDAPHERAWNTLVLAAGTAQPVAHTRYAQRPFLQRLVGSIFAVHRGSFFGTAGVVVFMLASLLMPLFAVTGWMLYLQRRRTKRARRQLQPAPQPG